jgi:hypothetical protein
MTGTNLERGLIAEAYMWSNAGPILCRDEAHAFRHKILNRGILIGYITADRSIRHPHVKRKLSCFQDGKLIKLSQKYDTVQEALTALSGRSEQ